MNSGILTIDDISSKNTPAIVDYLGSAEILIFKLQLHKARSGSRSIDGKYEP